ncbi:MAG: hypothetical protein ACLQGP_17720 [Isosphaeraceae bacterium]
MLAAMISGDLCPDRSARAQGKTDDEEAPAPAFRASDRQIFDWIFASDGDIDSARKLTESRLKSRIDDIDHHCGLNPDQRKKLVMAGRGDIKRFFDRVQETRNRFRRRAMDQAELFRAVDEARGMGREYQATLFHSRSIFAKVLGATLAPEQANRYRRDRDEARLHRHQSRVEWAALTLQKQLFLSDGQRVRLLGVLLEETRPPRRFGPSDYYGIMYQAAKIPETRLKPIFAESEWRLLEREFVEARSQERFLKESGYLPEEDVREPGASVGAFESRVGVKAGAGLSGSAIEPTGDQRPMSQDKQAR